MLLLLAPQDMEEPSAAGNVYGWGLSYHDNTRDPRAAVGVDYGRPRHGRMALRLTLPSPQPVIMPVSNAGATPGGCSGGDQGFQLSHKGAQCTSQPPTLVQFVDGMVTSIRLRHGAWLGRHRELLGAELRRWRVDLPDEWMVAGPRQQLHW